MNFIRGREGCELKAYQDTGGVWTIGWGNTNYYGIPVYKGLTITRQQADNLYKWSLSTYENMVKRDIKIPLNQNEFNALVSLCYNTGYLEEEFIKRINNKIMDLDFWSSYRIRDRLGNRLSGLVTRRIKEYNLYKTNI